MKLPNLPWNFSDLISFFNSGPDAGHFSWEHQRSFLRVYGLLFNGCSQFLRNSTQEKHGQTQSHMLHQWKCSYWHSSLLTLMNVVNLCLSSGGLPLWPGYCQSMSIPSNSCWRRNTNAELMNFLRFSGVATTLMYLNCKERHTVQNIWKTKTNISIY